MLKKFQWFGDPRNILQSRKRDLPEKQTTNSSVPSQHRKIPTRTAKSTKRFSRCLLRCKSVRPHRDFGTRESGFGSSVLAYPDLPASCRLNFKGWFQGLCICGRRRRGCNKTFAAWRYFRKDCNGSVPVIVEAFSDFHQEQRSQFKFLDESSSNYSLESDQPPMSSDVSVTDRMYDPRIGSLETGGTHEDFNGLRGNPWCKILYWEGRERKGSEFPVQNSSINVLGDTPHGSGLSLAALFGGVNRDDRIMKTRKKICQGLVLWREEEVIWIYNRSEAPVYLNSASLDGSFFHLNLYKCPPGYAMIIYYYEMARHLMGHPEYNNRALDKADVNSVRISFAKGWGKNYHRREILCCPCWIEVHVVPTLRVEQLTPPR